jgi:hypothetical protein
MGASWTAPMRALLCSQALLVVVALLVRAVVSAPLFAMLATCFASWANETRPS